MDEPVKKWMRDWHKNNMESYMSKYIQCLVVMCILWKENPMGCLSRQWSDHDHDCVSVCVRNFYSILILIKKTLCLGLSPALHYVPWLRLQKWSNFLLVMVFGLPTLTMKNPLKILVALDHVKCPKGDFTWVLKTKETSTLNNPIIWQLKIDPEKSTLGFESKTWEIEMSPMWQHFPVNSRRS